MKRNILFLAALLILVAHRNMAQTPKWVNDYRNAVFSVITYDKDDKMLATSNGFFTSPQGYALSDYSSFKGASRAVIINTKGEQMPVELIQGANSMYDVVYFKVNIAGQKKITALEPLTGAAPSGSTAYLLPYSTQKSLIPVSGKVKDVDSIGGKNYYYSVEMKFEDNMTSCPIVDANGRVIGIAQKPSGADTGQLCYAVSATYGTGLAVSPLAINDPTLAAINIKKGLPTTEEQALVYLYMASSSMNNEQYMNLLNEFISTYPESADGYIRRAMIYVSTSKNNDSMDKAAADMDTAMKLSKHADDAHYQFAKLIYTYQLSSPKETYKDWTYEKALDEVHAAIALSPLPVYTQLEGDIRYAMKDYADAFTAYEAVTKTNMASPLAFFNAAKAKEMAGGDYAEIKALMDSCITYCGTPILSDNAPYLVERARVEMTAKQYRPAMLDYDAYYEAMNGDVNDAFYYSREQASLGAKQYQRALDDIQKAIELNPKELLYRAELAAINIRVGRNEEALKVLDEALAIDSSYAEAYRLKGLAQLQLKKNNDACESFAKAKALGDPNVDVLIEKHCK
jgi:tetratricopeptide (TPR) repeat protein